MSDQARIGVAHRPEIDFDTTIITLLVGPEKKRFLVNQSVLSQTPVFRAMTEHAFVEKATGIVALPEDDPAHINCLLRFLYAGDYTAPKELEHPVAFEYSGGKDGGLRSTADEETSEVINQQKFEIGEELAELYVLDDKYQVPDFQARTLDKLKLSVRGDDNPMAIFQVCTILQPFTIRPDRNRVWLRQQMRKALHAFQSDCPAGDEIMPEYLARSGKIIDEDAGSYEIRDAAPEAWVEHLLGSLSWVNDRYGEGVEDQEALEGPVG